MSSPRLETLGPLRHQCHLCGTCCEGWKVSVKDAEERRRIEHAARQLGIDRPIVDGALRQEGGRCIFLDERRLCRIHAELGAETKPRVCQLFPKHATLTETGYRAGLDPACTSTGRTWVTGPVIDPLPASQEERRLPADVAASEAGLIRLAGAPRATVAFFVGHLTGDPRHVPELPSAFAARACRVLVEADFAAVQQIQGPDVAARLGPVLSGLGRLDATEPPRWKGQLNAGDDAFALEVLRRQLFLRLGDPAVPPFAQALLVVLGALAAGWTRSPAVPEALSAWARYVRTPAVWQRLLPDLERARWLVMG